MEHDRGSQIDEDRAVQLDDVGSSDVAAGILVLVQQAMVTAPAPAGKRRKVDPALSPFSGQPQHVGAPTTHRFFETSTASTRPGKTPGGKE